MASKLYVGGLSPSTTSESLRAHFGQCGNVVSAAVVLERETAVSRGFGFVEMSSDTEAQNAITTLDQKLLDGAQVTVNTARSKTERSGPAPSRGRRF